MGGRTTLYKICLVFFPIAFAAFFVGFGTPVWIGDSNINQGLWQGCFKVFKNCSTIDFDVGADWVLAIKGVEIFAGVMLLVAAIDLVYENCASNFGNRPVSLAVAAGVFNILGGLGGLSGVVVYVVKLDMPPGYEYSWSFGLVAGGSGLAVILGVGFSASACFIEASESKAKSKMNGHGPYLAQDESGYEMDGYTNRAVLDDRGQYQGDNLPGYAMYNGMISNQPGQRNSMPVGPSVLPPLPPTARMAGMGGGMGMAGGAPKAPGYFSVADDRLLDPAYDLSEGFMPARPRPAAPRGPSSPYSGGVARSMIDEPYSQRRGQQEDPYSRGAPPPRGSRYGGAPPRAGYNDPYGFDRSFDRAAYSDTYYRPGQGRF